MQVTGPYFFEKSWIFSKKIFENWF